MDIEITKETAVSLYKTQAGLARALGINRQAVHQWPEGKPIPELHALRLRFLLKPEAFKK